MNVNALNKLHVTSRLIENFYAPNFGGEGAYWFGPVRP